MYIYTHYIFIYYITMLTIYIYLYTNIIYIYIHITSTSLMNSPYVLQKLRGRHLRSLQRCQGGPAAATRDGGITEGGADGKVIWVWVNTY